MIDSEVVKYINQNVHEFIKKLKNREGKDIWLIGGAETVELLHNNDLIDEYILFIMPIVLGKGISLFSHSIKQTNLFLSFHKAYKSGVIHIIYERELK